MYTTLKYEKTWLVVEEDGKPIWLGYVTETEKLFDLSYKLYAEACWDISSDLCRR